MVGDPLAHTSWPAAAGKEWRRRVDDGLSSDMLVQHDLGGKKIRLLRRGILRTTGIFAFSAVNSTKIAVEGITL